MKEPPRNLLPRTIPTTPLAVAASLPKPPASARLRQSPSLKRKTTPLSRARMSKGMNPPPVLLSSASSKSFPFLGDIGWERMTIVQTLKGLLRHNEGWDRLAFRLGLSCTLLFLLSNAANLLWILVSERNSGSCNCSSSPKPSQHGINWFMLCHNHGLNSRLLWKKDQDT